MTASATPDEPVPSASLHPGAPPASPTDVLKVLAAVAYALDSLAPDADDSALLDALGEVLIPEISDLCLLHTADATGQLDLVGIVPSATAEAEYTLATLDEQGASMTIYEPLVDDDRPVLVTATTVADVDPDDPLVEHLALTQLAGLTWELVVPLHAGGPTDALLVLDRTASGRHARAASIQSTADDAGTLHLARVLASLVSRWRTNRALRQSEEALRAQLDDSALAGRELAHTLNNCLTMPVGVVEMVLDRGALSADLHELVQAASKDLTTLERHIRAFQNQMRTFSSDGLRGDMGLPPP